MTGDAEAPELEWTALHGDRAFLPAYLRAATGEATPLAEYAGLVDRTTLGQFDYHSDTQWYAADAEFRDGVLRYRLAAADSSGEGIGRDGHVEVTARWVPGGGR